MKLWITPEAEEKLSTSVSTPNGVCHHDRKDLIFVHKDKAALIYCVRCHTDFGIVGISLVDFETFEPKGVFLMGSDIVFEPSEDVLKEALQGWIDATMDDNFVINEVEIGVNRVRVAASLKVMESVPEKNLARELLKEAVEATKGDA